MTRTHVLIDIVDKDKDKDVHINTRSLVYTRILLSSPVILHQVDHILNNKGDVVRTADGELRDQ